MGAVRSPAEMVDQELEGLLAGAKAKQELRPVIAKVAYSHAAMIDLIIANPGISQNALAAHFGYTPSWVSQVIASDTFQSALSKRREEIVDPVLMNTVKENFDALVLRSLDILHQKLNRPALDIPDNLALRALEIGSRAAGYGAKDPSQPPASTPAEVHIHLEQLGGGLVALLQRKKREAEAICLEPAAGQSGSEPAVLVSKQIAQLTDDSQQD